MTHRTALRPLILGLAGSVLTNTPALARQETNRLTASERADGWQLLFDGNTADAWRGFRQTSMPDGWQVVDGTLTRVAPGGDIISKEQFENFELRLELKVAEAGNSGIMPWGYDGVIVTYDRLANGWSGAPGPNGDVDRVFSITLNVSV